MSVTIRIPTQLRSATGGASAGSVTMSTVMPPSAPWATQ